MDKWPISPSHQPPHSPRYQPPQPFPINLTFLHANFRTHMHMSAGICCHLVQLCRHAIIFSRGTTTIKSPLRFYRSCRGGSSASLQLVLSPCSRSGALSGHERLGWRVVTSDLAFHTYWTCRGDLRMCKSQEPNDARQTGGAQVSNSAHSLTLARRRVVVEEIASPQAWS